MLSQKGQNSVIMDNISNQIKSNILLDKAQIAYMRNPLYNTDMANNINNTI